MLLPGVGHHIRTETRLHGVGSRGRGASWVDQTLSRANSGNMRRAVSCGLPWLLVGLSLIGGCRGGSQPNFRYSLGFSGELRYTDGKPAPPCRIRLIPFESYEGFVGVEAEGESLPTGKFSLKTLGTNRVFPGRYKVVLTPLTELPAANNEENRIPERYRQFETTDLIFDISPKARHLYLLTIKRE